MKESNQQRAKEILKPYRREIDDLDDQILKLLGKRFAIVRKVAEIKTKHDLPAFLLDRVEEVRNSRMIRGKKYGINPQLVYMLYSAIIFEACGLEDQIKAKLGKKKKSK